MSRFINHPKPPLFPHFDIHDRDSSENDGGYWDMGVDLENYDGPVYIKSHYIQEIARLMGMVDGDQVAELKQENELLREGADIAKSLEKIPERLEELRDELAGHLAHYNDGRVNNNAVGSGLDIHLEDYEVPSITDGTSK